jgi:hypothetical protein
MSRVNGDFYQTIEKYLAFVGNIYFLILEP